MSSLLPDLTTRIHPQPPYDRFDQLPDSLLLLILNRLSDVKTLGRCNSLSRRFHSLIPQVQNVVVRVDCVISDDSSSSSTTTTTTTSNKSRISTLFRTVLTGIVKPIQTLAQLLTPKRQLSSLPPSPALLSVGNGDDIDNGDDLDGVTHHSPAQVLKSFTEIRFLKIELPAGELGLDDGVLLRWRADFGSTLNNCVMLGASSVTYPDNKHSNSQKPNSDSITVNDDNGSIPESFYTNGGLKLRVVWTISSLIAASARHYILQPIISDHKSLDSVTLTDADGQGVLCMNREQLEELRVKPLSASSASKRTLVPALNMRLWYAPYLELPDGTVLKGATLVATRPSDQSVIESSEGLSVSSTFDEPFGTAARMLVKRRTYCLEMNSF